jgi:hypothetical protein
MLPFFLFFNLFFNYNNINYFLYNLDLVINLNPINYEKKFTLIIIDSNIN